tara:strand:- start:495 stop:647 length:153 start_codon:yes stop_codon:yes gene_type:complete
MEVVEGEDLVDLVVLAVLIFQISLKTFLEILVEVVDVAQEEEAQIVEAQI